MTREALISRIKSLELQLAVLKAQLNRPRSSEVSKSFSDLYGILKGKVSSDEQEIEEAKYRFKWENTEQR